MSLRQASSAARFVHKETPFAHFAIEAGTPARFWYLWKASGALWYVFDGVPVLVMPDFGRKASHDSFRGALENFLDGYAVGAPNWGMKRGRNRRRRLL